MTSPNGQFLDLNAARRQHPKLTRIHPGVVRRNHPEPDRSLVEGFIPTAPPLAAESEPEPVAAKKKARKRLTDGDKKVAIARVNSLVKAGEEIRKASKTVAKEFGCSALSLERWRRETLRNGGGEPAAVKPTKKRAGKKKPAAALAAPVERDALATEVLSAFAAWLDAGVREVVRQEIRRMLA